MDRRWAAHRFRHGDFLSLSQPFSHRDHTHVHIFTNRELNLFNRRQGRYDCRVGPLSRKEDAKVRAPDKTEYLLHELKSYMS